MAVGNQFSTVGKVLSLQTVVGFIVAICFFVFGGWNSTISPLIGSGIALIPNMLFALRIYLARGLDAQGIVKAFYSGEAIKLVLTTVLFVVALKSYSVNFMTLLAGYMSVLSVFWFALYYWRD